MLDYFFAGGPLFMGLLTIVLLALLVGIKKFPHQLKTLGQLALALGVLGTALGLFEAFKAVEASKGVSQTIWAGGLKNALLPTLYGLMLYVLSRLLILFKNK